MTDARTGGACRFTILVVFLVSASACVGTPRIASTSLAPPRFHCDHDSDPECEEYDGHYLDREPTFTCRDEHDSHCTPPFVVPSGDYFTPASLSKVFGEERGRAGKPPSGPTRPYALGLALAGGGTKAASYAMGVLAGIYDQSNRELSERLDAVSSVSGGSYASVWYFSRLIDGYQIASEHLDRNWNVRGIFDDCLPAAYRALAAPMEAKGDPPLCSETASQFDPNKKNRRDQYRFQNHLRGYQDVFGKTFDLTPNVVGKDSETAIGAALRQFLFTLPLLPAHWLANGLFDFGANLSFSAIRYFNGIARTYSYRPVNCGVFEPVSPPSTSPCAGNSGRPSQNTQASRGHTMSALASLYYNQHAVNAARIEAARRPDPSTKRRPKPLPRIPFWIANTTAGVERSWWQYGSNDRAALEDSVFEFTPYSFGSRHFGRWVGTPANVELSKVAGASGAFLDAQQRTLQPLKNVIASAAMRTLALNWGISIANPRWRDEVRLQHRLIPYPLYWFHHDSKTRDGAWIHLSDGGQSENTGVWSLVRRGAETILVADESHDGDGKLEDLCYLRKQLAGNGLHLFIPDLENLDCVCGKDGAAGPGHYDLWRWPVKYLRGCISGDATDAQCANPDPRGSKYFARLLIFKPAVDLLGTLQPYLTGCDPGTLQQNAGGQGSSCRAQLEKLRATEPGYERFPAEVFGFLARNFVQTLDGQPTLRVPTATSFPQNSTVWMTLDSSFTLFGAYRDLAKWQLEGIVKEIDHPSQATRAVPVVGPCS